MYGILLPHACARENGKRNVTKKALEHPQAVFTIGHSTRELAEFIRLLQAHSVTKIADVRTVPRSRHNPQFNRETLPDALKTAGIGYVHLPGLGGLRHARADSPNMAWRNASFRGYADYMQTDEFTKNMESLTDLAKEEHIAPMCAEAVPWRCHRSLIADALTVRGITVEHIMSIAHRQPHTLTPWARVEGRRITYPAETLPANPAQSVSLTINYTQIRTMHYPPSVWSWFLNQESACSKCCGSKSGQYSSLT
jgi:hypothetical protein